MIPMVLASASAVRARLLESAGVTVTVDPAGIGEEDVKASLKADGASASLIADALADLKARAPEKKIVRRRTSGLASSGGVTEMSTPKGTYAQSAARVMRPSRPKDKNPNEKSRTER